MKSIILLNALIAEPNKTFLWIMPTHEDHMYIRHTIIDNLPKGIEFIFDRTIFRIKGFKGRLILSPPRIENLRGLELSQFRFYKPHKLEPEIFDGLNKLLLTRVKD